jgi:hypothetical protein
MSLPEKQTTRVESIELVLASPRTELIEDPTLSEFERSLFSEGVYVFEPTIDYADAEGEIASSADWYDNNPYWDDEQTRDSINRDVFQKRWELAWKQHFSGKVPKDWEMWHAPMDDIEEAGNRRIQLSSTLIDAAVSHDHHLVANKVGTLQDLNTHQLAIAFARELPPWNIGQIVEAQVKRGMSEEQVDEARKLAEEISKH